MHGEEPHDQHAELSAAVQLTRALHDADWGDWSLEAIRSLVADRPGWELAARGETFVVLRPGDGLEQVVLWTQKYGPDATRYQKAEAQLPAVLREDEAAFDALVEALGEIGTPVIHRGTAGRPTLRWRNADRVLILQRNSRRVWLAAHPRATAGRSVPSSVLESAADAAAELHDAASGQGSGKDLERIRLLYSHAPDASLVERRAAFGELFDAVVGGIGQPTVHGGAADGPDVRWRTTERLLLLRGNSRHIWLERHNTQEQEDIEHRTFKWGGAWTADETPDFAQLPYLWQLDRQGPGDNPQTWPGWRLAMSVERLRESLESLLAAWIEQLPAQVGPDWAGFQIVNRRASGRELSVGFEVDCGLWLYTEADQPESEESATAMRERGWQEREGFRWRADFPEPTRQAAADAARLIAAELTAQGAKIPENDLSVRDVSCFDSGMFDLFGLGIGR
ncbi:hypothetical protein ACTWQF_01210 [Streptomyces sp. 8N114]|uniref:hypothetical protein n=1 Tax=Streptomyces sp. 8N114 TaxID=3457419 RepID=UPI003FD2511A